MGTYALGFKNHYRIQRDVIATLPGTTNPTAAWTKYCTLMVTKKHPDREKRHEKHSWFSFHLLAGRCTCIYIYVSNKIKYSSSCNCCFVCAFIHTRSPPVDVALPDRLTAHSGRERREEQRWEEQRRPWGDSWQQTGNPFGQHKMGKTLTNWNIAFANVYRKH